MKEHDLSMATDAVEPRVEPFGRTCTSQNKVDTASWSPTQSTVWPLLLTSKVAMRTVLNIVILNVNVNSCVETHREIHFVDALLLCRGGKPQRGRRIALNIDHAIINRPVRIIFKQTTAGRVENTENRRSRDPSTLMPVSRYLERV